VIPSRLKAVPAKKFKILLLVYGMYLLFQLKSHAYMYESTPQHIIDEESAPGPVAAWMDSSSSDDDTSSGSDSDGSRGSNTTAGRIRRVMRRGRRRRKSSVGSRDTDHPLPTRTPSYANSSNSPICPDVFTEEPVMSPSSHVGRRFGAIEVNDVPNDDMVRSRTQSFNERQDKRSKKGRKHKKKRHDKNKIPEKYDNEALNEKAGEPSADNQTQGYNEPRRIDFAMPTAAPATPDSAQRKPFTIRRIGIRPAIQKTFSPNVFTQAAPAGSPHLQTEPPVVTGPIPRVRYGIRRTNSLPDRLNQAHTATQPRLPPASLHLARSDPAVLAPEVHEEENISRTTAIVLLLISTGLVALCANFMVDSIDSVTSNTALGATFVGLILLPIVGNAAEHVTAVTVASKNKMDLAIGVAVGSSIQIGMSILLLNMFIFRG
jgi:Ca2+:H+ antiporter